MCHVGNLTRFRDIDMFAQRLQRFSSLLSNVRTADVHTDIAGMDSPATSDEYSNNCFQLRVAAMQKWNDQGFQKLMLMIDESRVQTTWSGSRLRTLS